MMAKNRNASAVIFGFDYQVDAAICLFVRNVSEIEKIRVEGKYEDIEQILSNGSIIYCQVKSVIDPINTTDSTKRNKIRKALQSLTECPITDKDKMIYCSNQKDILISNSELFSSNNVLEYEYDYLDESSKKMIKKYFKNQIDKCKSLSIIKIPYNISTDDKTRRTFIYDSVKEFLLSVKEEPALSYSICKEWHEYLKNSSYGKPGEFFLTKKELIWVLIASIISNKIDYDLVDDEQIVDDVKKRCDDLFLNKLLNFEIFNKLNFIYEEEKMNLIGTKVRITNIFEKRKREILDIIFSKNEYNDIDVSTAFIIFSAVVRLKNRIKTIKEECKIED